MSSSKPDASKSAPPTETVFTVGARDHTSEEAPRLAHTLKPRHLSMIALGGIIGAGLLVASSSAIEAAGPGVLISYGLAGVVIVLVMRMLGEMASASPDTGSFSAYATKFIGPWAGLSIGWLYWWFWVVTVGVEATAASRIITKYVDMPQWVPALVLTLFFLGLNLVSVKSFGEMEFWFAGIKIVAISLFIVFGVLLLAHVIPSEHQGVDYAAEGGLLPNGIEGVFIALLPVIFSMFGAEVATVAAGESENPAHAVRKAVNTVVWRIMLFYIGSIAIIVLLLPHSAVEVGVSPFVSALTYVGIPGTDTIMDIVVLTAMLSTLNASLYTASRMAFSLAGRGEAPRSFRRVNGHNTPYVAILASASVGLISVVLNYAMPKAVFNLLVNSTGAVAIFVWLVIAVSELRSRKMLAAQGIVPGRDRGTIRMWGFPWITWLVIISLVALLVYMTFNRDPEIRVQLYLSLVVAGVSVVAGVIVQRRQHRSAAAEQVDLGAAPADEIAETADPGLYAEDLAEAEADAAERHADDAADRHDR